MAHYFLITNGLDIGAQALHAEIDKLSHNRFFEYKTHAGKLARLGIFVPASIPYGMSKTAAIDATDAFAKIIADRYGCAVEGVLHLKYGQHDHAHFIITGPLGW